MHLKRLTNHKPISRLSQQFPQQFPLFPTRRAWKNTLTMVVVITARSGSSLERVCKDLLVLGRSLRLWWWQLWHKLLSGVLLDLLEKSGRRCAMLSPALASPGALYFASLSRFLKSWCPLAVSSHPWEHVHASFSTSFAYSSTWAVSSFVPPPLVIGEVCGPVKPDEPSSFPHMHCAECWRAMSSPWPTDTSGYSVNTTCEKTQRRSAAQHSHSDSCVFLCRPFGCSCQWWTHCLYRSLEFPV